LLNSNGKKEKKLRSEKDVDSEIAYIIFGIVALEVTATIIVSLWLFIRNREKIAMRILTSLGRTTIMVKPNFESNVVYAIIRKENKRKNISEWKAKITQVIQYPKRFSRTGREAYIMPEATETISFDFTGNGIIQPVWDKKTSTEYINAKVLKNEGEGLKPTFPTWILYLTLLLAGITTFIGILLYLKLGRL